MGLGIGSIVSSALSPLLGAADELFTSGEEKAIQKNKFHQMVQTIITDLTAHISAEVNAQRDVVVAEAKGHSWLQRNWRPMVALFFAGLIGAHWFGFTAPNLSEEQILSLIGLVKIMIGGYVGSRGIEKVAVPIVAAFKGNNNAS